MKKLIRENITDSYSDSDFHSEEKREEEKEG